MQETVPVACKFFASLLLVLFFEDSCQFSAGVHHCFGRLAVCANTRIVIPSGVSPTLSFKDLGFWTCAALLNIDYEYDFVNPCFVF